jgi:hypothetical protein
MRTFATGCFFQLALAWALPFCVQSSAEQRKIGEEPLPIGVLTNLARGMLLTELAQRTGVKPQHQFTAMFGSNNVSCVKLSFDRPRGYFYFLFQNGELAAIQNRGWRVEFETNTYPGRPRQVPKARNPEAQMAKVLQGQDLSPNEIAEKVEEWSKNEIVASRGKEPMNILPAITATAPLFAPKRIRAENEAASLAEKFDPFKIKLGMTTNETQAVFGEPELRLIGLTNRVEHVYGAKLSPFAPSITPSVWVSVIFEDGKVTRIFSHDFFDKRLVNGVP